MPNHCYNRVQISNDAEDNSKQFDELVAIFESKKPFSKIIPIPNFLEIPNEDGELPVRVEHKNPEGEVLFTIMEFPKSKKGDDRWYQFCVQNWGTKWEAYDFCTMDIEEDSSIEYLAKEEYSDPKAGQIVSFVREKYSKAETSRRMDEERWVQAYRNYLSLIHI